MMNSIMYWGSIATVTFAGWYAVAGAILATGVALTYVGMAHQGQVVMLIANKMVGM
jgi:hypothetical protein